MIGEAPGADEDLQGKGFIGSAGRILHNLLEARGLHRGQDYGCANIVRCRPPGNRKPTSDEVWNCLPNLANTILQTKPKALLLVGGTAASIFFGPGSLSRHVALSKKSPTRTFDSHSSAHPLLATALTPLAQLIVIPMPHTSPLAWHRKAPDGMPWSQIGREQIQIVAKLLSSS